MSKLEASKDVTLQMLSAAEELTKANPDLGKVIDPLVTSIVQSAEKIETFTTGTKKCTKARTTKYITYIITALCAIAGLIYNVLKDDANLENVIRRILNETQF